MCFALNVSILDAHGPAALATVSVAASAASLVDMVCVKCVLFLGGPSQ